MWNVNRSRRLWYCAIVVGCAVLPVDAVDAVAAAGERKPQTARAAATRPAADESRAASAGPPSAGVAQSPASRPADDGVLSDHFTWVPKGVASRTRRVSGATERVTVRTRTPATRPATLTIQRIDPPAPEPTDERPRPRVWCAAAGEHVSPITGNLLRDGHLQYEAGPARVAHRIGNEIWNVRDKTVRLFPGSDRVGKFLLVTELEGRRRRIEIRADDLDGPRVLPAEACVRIWRLWYVRGRYGRSVDGWWDEPLTLIRLREPLEVPPPDNGVAGQTNQAFLVRVQVPRGVFAGTYRTTLHVRDLDDPAYAEDVAVEITAVARGQ